MTMDTSTTPYEQCEEDDNKYSCTILDCEEEAIEQLDLPFGEYGSTIFFLYKECKEMIENMGNS